MACVDLLLSMKFPELRAFHRSLLNTFGCVKSLTSFKSQHNYVCKCLMVQNMWSFLIGQHRDKHILYNI